MTCENCHWRYPNELVQPYYSSNKRLLTCGICALELSNELHGVKRTKFDGERAERARQGAINWRKNHPECEHPSKVVK